MDRDRNRQTKKPGVTEKQTERQPDRLIDGWMEDGQSLIGG